MMFLGTRKCWNVSVAKLVPPLPSIIPTFAPLDGTFVLSDIICAPAENYFPDGELIASSTMLVLTVPGSIANTRTPEVATSNVMISVSRIRAAFPVTYADMWGVADAPEPLTPLMIRPLFRRSMLGVPPTSSALARQDSLSSSATTRSDHCCTTVIVGPAGQHYLRVVRGVH